MKKLLILCFVIMGIFFVAGCIGGEKTTTSGIVDNSRSSGILLNPSNLLSGYYSSDFKSYAIPEVDSFEIRPNFSLETVISERHEFENKIPAGKKRVATFFQLANEDNTIAMTVRIYESDSDSKLKEYISKMYENGNKAYYTLCSIGDNCIQHTEASTSNIESSFIFSIKNKFVSIVAFKAYGTKQEFSKETIQTEILKVAEAIKNKID